MVATTPVWVVSLVLVVSLGLVAEPVDMCLRSVILVLVVLLALVVSLGLVAKAVDMCLHSVILFMVVCRHFRRR